MVDDSATIADAFALDPSFGGERERALALRIRYINEQYAGRSKAQGHLIEEALRLARKTGDEYEEAFCLLPVALPLMGVDQVRADSCLQQATRAITVQGTPGELAMVLTITAGMLYHSGDTHRSFELFDRASRKAIEGGARFQQALCEGMIGNLYWDLGNYPMAMGRMITALKQYEAVNYLDGICATENNIGCLYREMGDMQSALQHFQNSYVLALKLNMPDRIIAGLNDIGLLELGKGDAKAALIKFTEALHRCPEVEGAFGPQGLCFRLAESHRNIGGAKAALGDMIGASSAFEASARIADQGGLQLEATKTRVMHAEALLAATPSRPERAIQLYKQAADDADKNGWLNLHRDALQGLSEAHERLDDPARSLHYLKEYLVVKDSLLSADKARAVSNLQIQYETEKKEQQIVLLGKEKEVQQQEVQKQKLVRNGFIGGFALVGLFALVFFVQRNRISKARKRSDELLLNILPEEVAEELKDTGAAQAKHFDTATILFTDFKGFTQASEQMSPQELVEELNACFKAFDEIITARGIEKIKTIGDAYMCAGGLPDPASSSPADVLHAALEMQAFMKQRKAERDAQGLPAFEMRVGIHTGPVVAGIVGVKKFQYDIWGDTVNTASRMESSGEVGQVNISEATYALVKNETGLSFTSRGKVQAKGKGEMEMYFAERSA